MAGEEEEAEIAINNRGTISKIRNRGLLVALVCETGRNTYPMMACYRTTAKG